MVRLAKIRGVGHIAVIGLGLFAGVPVLTGCVGAVVGAGASVGSMALEERGLRQSGRDRLTEARIAKELASDRLNNFRTISVEVVEGRVMLVGQVTSEAERLAAVKIAWADKATLEVINDIMIGPESSLSEVGYDAGISARFQAAILGDSDVRGVNYYAEVVNGRLSLIGIANDDGELQKVLQHINAIPHVRQVFNHVLLRFSSDRQDLLQKLNQRLKELEVAG